MAARGDPPTRFSLSTPATWAPDGVFDEIAQVAWLRSITRKLPSGYRREDCDGGRHSLQYCSSPAAGAAARGTHEMGCP